MLILSVQEEPAALSRPQAKVSVRPEPVEGFLDCAHQKTKDRFDTLNANGKKPTTLSLSKGSTSSHEREIFVPVRASRMRRDEAKSS